jgi:flagellum-specific ATP synthase
MSVHPLRQRLRNVDPVRRTGRVRKVMPTHIEADGPNVALGCLCEIATQTADGVVTCCAEVVRVGREGVVLSPIDRVAAIGSGVLVRALAQGDRVPVGPQLLGRAVDGLARPFDGLGAVSSRILRRLRDDTPSPLDRVSPRVVLETGIRAIDVLLTLGKGQRVGIFAASGAGKTTLTTQIARGVTADVVIVCQVGERGREVESFWNHEIDEATRKRATLVAATSDQSAAMRVRAADYALTLATYWRDEGKHVLFILDSVTRLAMAMREMGLSAGEPPTVRAYTPSVFAQLPKLVERCGAVRGGGAISAVICVLSESDEIADPVSEMMKSLLDGHIVLSRPLAEQAHYPAIDVCRSVSRQSELVTTPAQRQKALKVLEWVHLRQSSKTLIDSGIYSRGTNPQLDRAIERYPEIVRFLRQDRSEIVSFSDSTDALDRLVGEGR